MKLGGIAAGVLALMSGTATAAPTLTEVLAASGVTASGYVDASFNYNNRQYDAGIFTYGGANADSFALNQAGLTLSMTPESGFGGVVDVLAGRDAGGLVTDGGGDIVLKQGYVQYATGGLTVIGGRFLTLAGSEVIADTGNSNASRSLLFFYQPLTHTGVRGAYKIGSMFTVTGGLNNSYFGFTNDPNEQKTVELSLAVAPADGLSFALTGYKGHESVAGAPDQSPSLIDLVGSFQVTKTLGLGMNFDHVSADDPAKTRLNGLALYANLQVCDMIRLGLRAEYLKTTDDDAATDDHKQKEVTLTSDFALAKNFDLLADLRYDNDDAAPFGPSGGTGKKSMDTLLIKGIFKF